MRPKLTDIALKKIDAFQRKRVIEGLSIFDLLAAYDDVQRSALARPDQILLDIERCQISHAERRHHQKLYSYGHLSAPPLAGDSDVAGLGASTLPGASATRECFVGHRRTATAS